MEPSWMEEWWTAPPCCVSGCQLVPLQVTEGQRVTESQVAHVENEIEVRAANIVSRCIVVLVPQTVHSRILVPQTIYVGLVNDLFYFRSLRLQTLWRNVCRKVISDIMWSVQLQWHMIMLSWGISLRRLSSLEILIVKKRRSRKKNLFQSYWHSNFRFPLSIVKLSNTSQPFAKLLTAFSWSGWPTNIPACGTIIQ